MDTDIEAYFKVADEVARRAGVIIKEAFYKEKQIDTKSSEVDLVTETDKAAEELIISGIKAHFPNHSFIGEESVAAGKKSELTDNPTWIIDPIDGTTNFVHKYPNVSVSIALLVKKEALVGVIYNPISETMYSAKLGQGAYCDGERLKVSNTRELSKALVITGFTANRAPGVVETTCKTVANVVSRARGIRSSGSAALNMCMMAAGMGDVYYGYGIHAWDIAAGDLIIREAGGVVRNMDCSPFDVLSRQVLCGSNIELVEEISPLIIKMEFERD